MLPRAQPPHGTHEQRAARGVRAETGPAARAGSRFVYAALVCLLALIVHGRSSEQRYFVGEEPDSLHPFSIEKLAASSAGHVVALPRADADQPVARLLHRAVIASGPAPRAARHRFVGALLHAGTALALLLALGRFVARPHIAVLTALAFAVHPLVVEPVAWISMHARVLAGLFSMLTLWLWAGPAPRSPATNVANATPLRQTLAWITFVLALASHPIAAPLPVLLYLRSRRPLPALVAGAMGIATIAIAWTSVATFGLSARERLLHAALAVGNQAKRALLPGDLAFSYPHPSVDGGGSVALAAIAWIVLAFVIAGALHILRKRASTGATGVIWFVSFALGSAILPYGRSFAPDRDAYLALPGLLLWLVSAGTALVDRTHAPGARRGVRTALMLAFSIALLGAGRASWMRADRWSSPAKIVAEALALHADDPVVHEAHGYDLLRRGKLTAAEDAFRQALEQTPRCPSAHVGLAHIHIRRPALDAAAEELQRALALAPASPTAHERLGHVEHWRGDAASLARAANHFKAAYTAAPYYVTAAARYAVVSGFLKRIDDARAGAEHALAIDHDSRDAWFALALAAEQAQENELAIECYERSLAIEPDYADSLTRLGELYRERGDDARALVALERAYRVRPLEPSTHYPLALAYQAMGRLEDAQVFFERTLEANPRHMRALGAIGGLHLDRGDRDQARTYTDRALSLNPNHAVALEHSARLAMGDGDWGKAAVSLGRALSAPREPDTDRSATLALIHVLSAAPDSQVRRGKDALHRAQAWIAANGEDVLSLAALAAAYAETGAFKRAVAAMESAIEMQASPDVRGRPESMPRAELDRRLELYRNGEPLRLGVAADEGSGQ